MLNLVLARAYLLKLLNNARVVRHMAQNQGELLTAVQNVVGSVSAEGTVTVEGAPKVGAPVVAG